MKKRRKTLAGRDEDAGPGRFPVLYMIKANKKISTCTRDVQLASTHVVFHLALGAAVNAKRIKKVVGEPKKKRKEKKKGGVKDQTLGNPGTNMSMSESLVCTVSSRRSNGIALRWRFSDCSCCSVVRACACACAVAGVCVCVCVCV